MQSNKWFLLDRLREIPHRTNFGQTIAIAHYDDFRTGHCLRVSSIHSRLQEAGAVFIQIMGYERPALYLPTGLKNERPSQDNQRHRILETKSFGRPAWFDLVSKEYRACREKVAICDYGSFTKLELSSPGIEIVYSIYVQMILIYLWVVHTGMQNKSGGYENDVSLIRLDENRYMLVGPTEQQTRCLSWIRRNLRHNQVSILDITNQFTALCIMGPLASQLLSSTVSKPEIFKNFPFFTYKEAEIGQATGIRVCNLTHTGELGYVLYIPNEHALNVYDIIVNMGLEFGLKHVGSIAMRLLRIEKFYAFWGQDLDTTTTPLECGRSFRVKFDKDFIGKEPLLKQKREGIRRRYVQLILDDEKCVNGEIDRLWPWGNEPIFVEGHPEPIGMTTTTGFGFSMNRLICLGFVGSPSPNETLTNDYVLKTRFQVEIGGKRFWAKANIHSPKLSDIQERYVATR